MTPNPDFDEKTHNFDTATLLFLTNPNIVDIEDEAEEEVQDTREEEEVKNIIPIQEIEQQQPQQPEQEVPRSNARPAQEERNPGTNPRRLKVFGPGRARNENATPELEIIPKRPEEALFESVSQKIESPLDAIKIESPLDAITIETARPETARPETAADESAQKRRPQFNGSRRRLPSTSFSSTLAPRIEVASEPADRPRSNANSIFNARSKSRARPGQTTPTTTATTPTEPTTTTTTTTTTFFLEEILETETPEVFLVPLTEIPVFQEPQTPAPAPVPSILSQLPVQPIRNTFVIPQQPQEEEEEVEEEVVPLPPRQPPPQPHRQPQPQQNRAPVQQNFNRAPVQPNHRVPLTQQQQDAPRTRAPAPVTTTKSVASDYEYFYEYEDGTSAVVPAPKPVKTIDDYDLVPLSQKVKHLCIIRYLPTLESRCILVMG